MKILVTGGAGFIGSNLCHRLQGYDVRVIDSLSTQVHGKKPEVNLPGNIEFIHGSITDRDVFSQALQGVDVVVHLAAETGTAQSMSEIKRYSDANIGGTALLCDLIVNEKLPVKKIVLASSRAVYGEGNYYISTSEFAKTCPVSIYGATKLAQENILSVTGKMLGISIISLRFQNVYGVGQSLINPHTGIIPIFVQKLLKNESLSIFEKGNISRDFVYVDDAVDAIRLAIDYQEWIQDCFNVGSGRAVRLFGVAKRLKKLCHSESEIYLSSDSRLGDVKHHCANLKKINRTFGFEPKTSLDEGLKKFVAWVNNDRQDHR